MRLKINLDFLKRSKIKKWKRTGHMVRMTKINWEKKSFGNCSEKGKKGNKRKDGEMGSNNF